MNILWAVLPVAEQTPAPEDVKAGWVAFGLFVALGIAIVLLGFSLVKHLKRAKANFEAADEQDSSGRPERTE